MKQRAEQATTARGIGARALTYQEVIAGDAAAPNAIFSEIAATRVDIPRVSRKQYFDPDFAARERESMWSRVWYMAGRVEELPEPGDFIVYEGPLASVLLTRDDQGQLNAFNNSCPHRGMKLCSGEGSVSRITCPFHAFRWKLDGRLDHIPSRWDFPEINGEDLPLVRLRVSEWQGFIFVCHDPKTPSLEDYLGRIVTDFANWDHGKRYVAKKLRKVMHANWKTCIETFIEAFHLVGIHPQALPFGGDTSAQYDVWPNQPHMSRMLQPVGVVSDQWEKPLTEQDILAAALRVIMGPQAEVPMLPEGMNARAYLALMLRADPAVASLTDTELLDALQYSIFPNIVLFRSQFYPYVYRFTPDRADPNRATYDFYLFEPLPEDGVAPPVETIELAESDSFSQSGAFPPWLGQIYDQDTEGLSLLQAGLRDGGQGDIIFARYQESRIRHMHQVLDTYLAGKRP
jgi:phenylpropionate dioxygenase-like ring-hydroxylating dioxygenase large terminal subunit